MFVRGETKYALRQYPMYPSNLFNVEFISSAKLVCIIAKYFSFFTKIVYTK